MSKKNLIRRSFGALTALVMLTTCFPLSVFADETQQTADFSGTNLMNLENVEPSGYSSTTNPYGYDIDVPFLMVEQNELMYLNAWDGTVRSNSYYDMGTTDSLANFTKSKTGANGTFYADANYSLMEAVSFDPTGSGRRDHVAFVGISKFNKKGYLWILDTTDLNRGYERAEIGDFSYMYDGNTFNVPTYQNRSFLNIVAGDFDGDGKESVLVYTPENHYTDSDPGCQIQQWDCGSDGYLILYMSDGSSINAGLVRVNVDTAVASSTTVEKADGNTSEDGTTRALATAGVVTTGTSLLWNIVTLAVSFIRRKKTVI